MRETVKLFTFSILVGAIAGFGAAFFRWMIAFFQEFFFVYAKAFLSFMGNFWILAVLVTGGLLVGLLTYFGAREAKGHGVPEVMDAVWSKGGIIRPRVALIKSLASAICIGSGGSVGREGPIVQIGAAFGSVVGQAFKLTEDNIKLLVACGAAAGISATFNAPLGGVFFSMELILGTFKTHNFGFVVISSVVAGVISHFFLGQQPAFIIAPYILTSPWEIPLYGLLGIFLGVAGGAFIRIIYKTEDIFDSIKVVPEYLKPAIGALFVGLIGLYSFDVFGIGYGKVPWVSTVNIDEALAGNVTLTALFVMAILKVAATTLTLGSGGSGGVFAPSLFIGTMLGGCFGKIAAMALPNLGISPSSYGMIGMGAFFAGISRAPITAIIILFEMTRNYSLILPLLVCVVISTLMAHVVSHETMYTLKILRQHNKSKNEDLG